MPATPKQAQVIVDQIVRAVERDGLLPWQKPWRAENPDWLPRNGESKRPYSGINMWLTLCSPYTSPDWFTLGALKRLDAHIRAGEKPTWVTFWKKIKIREKESGKDKWIPLMRFYHVWNREQCEGLKAPVAAKPVAPFDAIVAAKTIVEEYPNGPKVIHRKGDRACYFPAADVVEMPEGQQFDRNVSYYAVLFHELIHSTGHKSRLDRLESTFFGSESYTKEELVAEMGAAMLAAEAGIADPALIDQSAAYLKTWLKRIQDDPQLLLSAAGKANKAVAHMRGRKLEEEAETETAAVAA
jgi:antirestriction protein ArdC